MEELMRLSKIRDEAKEEVYRCLRVDATIAASMEDYWKHQRCGAE